VGTLHNVTLSRGDGGVGIGRPRSRAAVLLSAALLLVAVVALSSLSGRQSSASLNESEEYLRVPKRLANLAADHDDRDGLARIMMEGHAQAVRDAAAAEKKQQQLHTRRQYGRKQEHRPVAKKWSKDEIAEQRAKNMNARDEKMMMDDETMVPWVRWPKRDEGDAFRDTARKQELLQMPMLSSSEIKDNAAHMLPLSAIMNRLSVDSKLHKGEVSDTQLAMADEQAIKKHPEDDSTGDKKEALDCKPFC